MAASSAHPSHMTYDTFISFNREQTFQAKDHLMYELFTKQLYESLCRWGMKVFMADDGGGSSGDTKKVFTDYESNLNDKIVKAIEGSKTCIVILSRGYVHSTGCLRELVKIVDHINKAAYQVLPLFCHDENHSYVPLDSMKYAYENIEILENMNGIIIGNEELQRWREAISQICSLSGVALRPTSL